MADGTISIDVELNETEFHAALNNMSNIVKSGADLMISSVGELSRNFVILPDTIDSIFKTVPKLINGVINNITSQNPVMSQTGTDFFMSLISTMPDIITNIAKEVPGISDNVLQTIKNVIPDMSETGSEFFKSIITNMPDIISAITTTVPDITTGIIDTVKKDNSLMSQIGFDLFNALTDELPFAIEQISTAPVEIVSSLLGVFNGLVHQFSSVGVNIVTGVWSGISSMASWLMSNVTGFFQGIVGSVTSFLGISSPSKLFKDKIGKNIALGISAGIDGEMPHVIADTKKQMTLLTAAANAGTINANAVDAYVSTRANMQNIRNVNQFANAGSFGNSAGENQKTVQPEIKVVLESTGATRDVFEALSVGIKRADYLSGGAKA